MDGGISKSGHGLQRSGKQSFAGYVRGAVLPFLSMNILRCHFDGFKLYNEMLQLDRDKSFGGVKKCPRKGPVKSMTQYFYLFPESYR